MLLITGAQFSAKAQSTPSAETIMARVAENQRRSIALRSQYVYQQRISIATRLPDGKLMRQETTEHQIIPTESGVERRLLKLDGQYWTRDLAGRDRYIEFHDQVPPDRVIDSWFFNQCREALLNDASCEFISWEGHHHILFPFTQEEQNYHRFELIGEEGVDRRKTYRIRFRPKNRQEFNWVGEILIDAQEFQPLTGYTRFARRIPIPARILWGTDLRGAGSSIHYQRLDDGVWFPISIGSEFRMHFLFFFNRVVTISSESFGFRRTNVRSTIQFENVLTSPNRISPER